MRPLGDQVENCATRYCETDVGLRGAPRSVMMKSIRSGVVISTMGFWAIISSVISLVWRSVGVAVGAGLKVDEEEGDEPGLDAEVDVDA